MRCRADVGALVAAGLLGGCAFGDGEPWGEVEPHVEVAFAPDASRLDEEGRLVTARSFAVELTKFEVTFDGLALPQLAEGGALSFDPANPPEGLSNCHSGHCHAEDGTLPTFEEIEAMLLDGAGGGGASFVLPALAPMRPGASPQPLRLAPCDGGACRLERGTVAAVQLGVEALVLEGRVFDRLPADRARLPAEGRELRIVLGPGVKLSRSVDEPIGDEAKVGLRIDARLGLPASLLDGVEFTAGDGPLEIEPGSDEAAAIAAALQDATFDVATERFDR